MFLSCVINDGTNERADYLNFVDKEDLDDFFKSLNNLVDEVSYTDIDPDGDKYVDMVNVFKANIDDKSVTPGVMFCIKINPCELQSLFFLYSVYADLCVDLIEHIQKEMSELEEIGGRAYKHAMKGMKKMDSE